MYPTTDPERMRARYGESVVPGERSNVVFHQNRSDPGSGPDRAVRSDLDQPVAGTCQPS